MRSCLLRLFRISRVLGPPPGRQKGRGGACGGGRSRRFALRPALPLHGTLLAFFHAAFFFMWLFVCGEFRLYVYLNLFTCVLCGLWTLRAHRPQPRVTV